MKNKIFLSLVLSLIPALSPNADDSDQLNSREISQKYFHPTRASLSGLRERGLEETGLVAVYPKEALLRGEPMDSASVRKLSADRKKVAIPYMTESGKVVNSVKARVIWPYACKPAGNAS